MSSLKWIRGENLEEGVELIEIRFHIKVTRGTLRNFLMHGYFSSRPRRGKTTKVGG